MKNILNGSGLLPAILRRQDYGRSWKYIILCRNMDNGIFLKNPGALSPGFFNFKKWVMWSKIVGNF